MLDKNSTNVEYLWGRIYGAMEYWNRANRLDMYILRHPGWDATPGAWFGQHIKALMQSGRSGRAKHADDAITEAMALADADEMMSARNLGATAILGYYHQLEALESEYGRAES